MKKIIIAQGKYSIAGAIISVVALIMAIVVMKSHLIISIMSPMFLRWLNVGCIVCCILSLTGFALCVAGLVIKKSRGVALTGICLSVLTLTGIPFVSYLAMEMCCTTVKMSIPEDVPVPRIEKTEPVVRIVLNAEGCIDCMSLASDELTARFSLDDEDIVRNLHNWLSTASDKETLSAAGAISIKCDSGVNFLTFHRLYDDLSVAGYNRFTVETRCLDEEDDEEDDDF